MKNRNKFFLMGVVLMTLVTALVMFFSYTKPLLEYGGCFTSIEFSSDGSRMLTRVGGGNMIMLWDVNTGRDIRTISGANADHLAISPDGHQAATGGNNNVNEIIVLWDLDTGQYQHIFEGSPVSRLPLAGTCVDFSADGQYLISAETEKGIVLWDTRSYEKVRSFRTEAPPAGSTNGLINSIKFSPDGRFAVSAGDRLILWDVGTGRISRVLKEYEPEAHYITHQAVITRDGRLVMSGGRDKTINIWSMESGEPLQSINLEYLPWAITFSPDGGLAVVERMFPGGSMEIWNLQQGALVLDIPTSKGSKGQGTLAFTVTPDGGQVAVGLCGRIELRDIKTGETVKTFKPKRTLFRVLVDFVFNYVRI